MIEIFTPAAKDQSIIYLYQVFGNMNNLIPNLSGGTAADINIISEMFRTFNGVVLAVGALIVIYTTVVGVIMTAAEGEAMGKKWGNIWIPIRTVLGIAALVPFGSGYSVIQIIMMWVILQGVGAADLLWTTALGYAKTFGARTTLSVPTSSTKQTLRWVFQGLACDKSTTITTPIPGTTMLGFVSASMASYYCQDKAPTGLCAPRNLPNFTSTQKTSFSLGPAGMCGILKYCNLKVCDSEPDGLACLACQAQRTALNSIMPTLNGIANRLVTADYEYQSFYQQGGTAPAWIQNYCNDKGKAGCTPQDVPTPNIGSASPPTELVNQVYWPYALQPILGNDDFISMSTDVYKNAILDAISLYIKAQGESNLSGNLAEAQENGWLYAGRYYYDLAGSKNNEQDDALPSFTFATVMPVALKNYRNNFDAAGDLVDAIYINAVDNATSSSSSSKIKINSASSSDSFLKIIVNPATSTAQDVADSAYGTSTSDSSIDTDENKIVNVLLIIQGVGYAMLLSTDALFVTLLYAMSQLGGMGFLSVFFSGAGAVNSIGPTAAFMSFLVMPAMWGMLGFMVVVGGLLGVYVPFIPYIIFTFGAIGWFMSTVEAMVAGPLVALGILSPTAHGHEFLGKAEPALMLIFNIFLRPTLMVFGLVIAMVFASMVLSFINSTFWSATPIWSKFSITALIIYLTVYVGIIVAVLNKSFALIYWIPEKVMGWISGQGSQYGEESALGEKKRSMESGVAGVKGGQSGAREGQGDSQKRQFDEKNHDKTKDNPTANTKTPPSAGT